MELGDSRAAPANIPMPPDRPTLDLPRVEPAPPETPAENLPGSGSFAIGEAAERLTSLAEHLSAEAYNFDHFRTIHLIEDVRRTVQTRGIPPGERAPDFRLPRADGGWLRLADLRGMPVVLHFGSST